MTLVFFLGRLFYAVLLLIVVSEGLLVTESEYDSTWNTSIKTRTPRGSTNRRKRKLTSNGQACKFPNLSVKHPDVMRYVEDLGPLVCSNIEDWVQVNGSKAFITENARKKFGKIVCRFTDILRETDDKVKDGIRTTSSTKYDLVKTDFIRVACKSKRRQTWENVMAGIRHDRNILDRTGWHKVPKDGLHLNVLIWGFDNLSRLMFVRKLPHSLRYLRETLGSFELQGYNTVGSGTRQNLVPFLTGKSLNELPEVGKKIGGKTQYVDIFPMIWKAFSANGYVTGYAEDQSHISTFNYVLNGFNTQPTNHYMRPFYIHASRVYKNHLDYCLGSLPRHKVMMNYVHDFFKVYQNKPKFMFAWHSELSHDENSNPIGYADLEFKQWLKTLFEDGHLNSTLLIIMSDHGNKFGVHRWTKQGKLEERLPMLSLVFPQWFTQAYPDVIRNVNRNLQRLTTPFDVHSTLLNVLHFNGAGHGDLRTRSISLFKEIPLKRTCGDAAVHPHYCSCIDWEEVKASDNTVQRAANAVVQFINKKTKEWRTLCSELKLDSIVWVGKIVPKQDLPYYPIGEYYLNILRRAAASEVMYQLQLRVQPGGALFEVTLRHNRQTGKIIIRESYISRINRYGPFVKCLTAKHLPLLRFCHCR